MVKTMFAAILMLLVVGTSARAQLTGTIDANTDRSLQGFSVNLAAGLYQVETTGNFTFLPPNQADTQIDTFYNYHRNGKDATPTYAPGDVKVDSGGTVQDLTHYTGDAAYKSDHLYDFSFTAPVTGTYRFFSDAIPAGDFAGGAINFVEKSYSPAPAVPEAATSISLGIMLALGGLAVVARKRRTVR